MNGQINTKRRRDGEMVSVVVLRALLSDGWELTSTSQVVDGVSVWLVVHARRCDTCIVTIADCDAFDIHPAS